MSSWIKDEVGNEKRAWEQLYRNRWQYDKTVRSTHGVNCTGGCSWMVHVKNGVVTWEMQATDYPELQNDIPPYEPRGCQRGISYSWYIYSPIRVKYPYIRGKLQDAWREAKKKHSDPVEAWASIQADPEKRKSYQQVRGKGGYRRTTWDEVKEIIVAAQIHTIKEHGPDRNISFSPIPAMSQVSYASGARYHQLIGGVSMSFYDYYTDLPTAFPETWGEQTDVCESANWYNSSYTVIMGSNPNMTRTPDTHFIPEKRYSGNKLVVLSPDYSQVSKYADTYVPLETGSDGAFWMAITHVILKEFFVDRQVPYFMDYVKELTNLPFLVKLDEGKHGYREGQFLRASDLSEMADVDKGEWKPVLLDEETDEYKVPKGSIGSRYPDSEEDEGKWNIKMEDERDDSEIDPVISFLDDSDDTVEFTVYELDQGEVYLREVPVRHVETADGDSVPVTTAMDLLMAQFGISRGLGGDYPKSYEDDKPFTPKWQEKYTGVDMEMPIQVAREFAQSAEDTNGRVSVIIGASINHWYHADLEYRAVIHALALCGAFGVDGGGLQHYVGQEKLAATDSWAQLAFANDWHRPPRLTNTPSFHYLHTGQWRYDGAIAEYNMVPEEDELQFQHTADYQVRAVRMGWLPCHPQFNESSLDLAKEAMRNGADNDDEITEYVKDKIVDGNLEFSHEDPDAESNWPRVWMIWRANALGCSARGEEYFFKYYLGTHHNLIADEVAGDKVEEITYRDQTPTGKIDLVVDINFRMNTTATYVDMVLPTATWYEKNDINSTDLHSFYHPLGRAVAPSWESKDDWTIFKELAKEFSELAKKHLPETQKDVVITPLGHDSPGEITQPATDGIKDWADGDAEPIPGETMPNIHVVERDFTDVYEKFVTLGPLIREKYGFHGTTWSGDRFYDEYIEMAKYKAGSHNAAVQGANVEAGMGRNVRHYDGEECISLESARDAANVILHFSSVTNGEVCYEAWKSKEHHTGLHGLADEMAGDYRGVRTTYNDLRIQPRRVLTAPIWSGDTRDGRPYNGNVNHVEQRIPWRTLTGRQELYLDHPMFAEFGEGLVTHKYKLQAGQLNELKNSNKDGDTLQLNFITPHGKWQIHSTYYDNLRMLTLSRGGNHLWINDKEAERAGIQDNDWVEAYNDNGIFVARATVSARIPEGIGYTYHSTERTIGVPMQEQRGGKRGGFHNSLTRQRLKPSLMAGGYAQFSYGFNAWGPIPIIRDTNILVKKMENQEVKWE